MGARYMQVFEGYLVLDTVEVRCCCCGEVLGLGDTRFSVISVSPGGAHLEQDDKFRTE